MASITIQHSHKNLLFAATVANETGAEFEENGQWITISNSPELEIPRYTFNQAFDPEGARAQRGQFTDSAWRSLLLNKRGYLIHFDDNEIVIADEKPVKAASFLLRFPSDAEKETAEHWAERACFENLTAYILAAVDAFNRHWQEQAGEKPPAELYEDNAGGLYLRANGNTWAEPEMADSTFADDAAAALAGDTGDWTVPQSDIPPLSQLVATYDGAVKVVGNPGLSARRYLGLPREQ